MAAVDARGVAPQLFTGFLLRRAYVVSRECAQACIGDDAAIREVPALALIRAQEPLTQRRLGVLLNLNRTTTGKLIDALMAKAWIARDRDARDRRSYVLHLTDEGRQALVDLLHSLERGEAELTGPLSTDEHARLGSALRQLLAGDATVSMQGLGDRCGYLIARAHLAMFRQATDALRPLGVTPRDFGLLASLSAAQPCSQQRLASIMGISPPAILAFIDDLEAAGLVVRRRNASDRRAYDLTLTSVGAAKLEAARVVALDLQAEIEGSLGSSLDADLRALLAKVVGIRTGPEPGDAADHHHAHATNHVGLAAS